MKQAPRTWYQRFTDYVTTLGFWHSTCDLSLFVYSHGTDTAYLLLYVDNIIFTISSVILHQQLLSRLSSNFSMKDLGPLQYFIGTLVKCNTTDVFLSQEKYASKIVSRAKMGDCNLVHTLVDTFEKLSSEAGDLTDDLTT